MRLGRVVEMTSGSGNRMSLSDLRAFVAEMDQAGAAETTPVTARVTFGGHLKQLRATAVRFGDKSRPELPAEPRIPRLP